MTAPSSNSGDAPQTMASFFTRQRANEGIEFPLDLPDGSPTAHRIRIRGVDSDAFKEAKADSKRRLLELAQSKDRTAIDNIDAEAEHVRLVATLVVSWTFPDECSMENVCKFLREAPQIMEQIDRIAARRSLFFPKDLKDSTPSQNTKSD